MRERISSLSHKTVVAVNALSARVTEGVPINNTLSLRQTKSCSRNAGFRVLYHATLRSSTPVDADATLGHRLVPCVARDIAVGASAADSHASANRRARRHAQQRGNRVSRVNGSTWGKRRLLPTRPQRPAQPRGRQRSASCFLGFNSTGEGP